MDSLTRRTSRLAVLIAATAVLAACTSGAATDAAPGSTVTVGTITHTLPPSATVTRTLTSAPPAADSATGSGAGSGPGSGASSGASSVGSSASSTAPPSAPVTSEPAPAAGTCPYLSDDDAAIMFGQRTGQTMLIAVEPAPICVFYRNDGGWMGTVRPIKTATADQAVAAVDGHIPRATSSPAEWPAGWTGGYMQLPDGAADWPDARSVYGVSKGELALVVWSNQEQTVKGRRIAETVIPALGW